MLFSRVNKYNQFEELDKYASKKSENRLKRTKCDNGVCFHRTHLNGWFYNTISYILGERSIHLSLLLWKQHLWLSFCFPVQQVTSEMESTIIRKESSTKEANYFLSKSRTLLTRKEKNIPDWVAPLARVSTLLMTITAYFFISSSFCFSNFNLFFSSLSLSFSLSIILFLYL